MAVADSTRQQLGYFIDVAVEILPDQVMRMTAMTRYSWEGLDKELVERILWELEDWDTQAVARKFSVPHDFVEGLSHLSGANGSGTLP